MQNSFLVTLLIGAVAGWLAGLFVRGSGYGIIGDIIVGILGGVAGRYLFAWLGFAPHLGSPLLAPGAHRIGRGGSALAHNRIAATAFDRRTRAGCVASAVVSR